MVDTDNISPENMEAVNAVCLRNELLWFVAIANERLSVTFPVPSPVVEKDLKSEPPRERGWLGKLFPEEQTDGNQSREIKLLTGTSVTAPDLTNSKATYGELVHYYNMTNEERLILILALIPHIQPQLLDTFLSPTNPRTADIQNLEGLKDNILVVFYQLLKPHYTS